MNREQLRRAINKIATSDDKSLPLAPYLLDDDQLDAIMLEIDEYADDVYDGVVDSYADMVEAGEQS